MKSNSTPPPVPSLSEIERLKLENFTLRHIAFESQLRQNQVDRAVFLKSLEETYPGWKWQDPDGLVEKEETPESPELYPEMTPHG
jgi:hypothetical protein